MPRERADRTFDTYLDEIQRYPLLSAAEEKALARRVQRQYEDHVDAMTAKDEMIKRNLRLVVSVAKKFQGRGLSLPDLVEEGNLGLVHAVEKFDPEMDTRFSTYATWWIKQAIRRSMMNTVKTVRAPTYITEELTRWRMFAREYEKRHGFEPTEEEIVAHTKPPPGRRRMLLRLYRNTLPGSATVSLDLLFESSETVVDPRASGPDSLEFASWEKAQVLDEIRQLPEREAQILRYRFGLVEGERELTLRQIAETMKISRERVRQLEHDALAKLRAKLDRTGPPAKKPAVRSPRKP